MPVLGDDFQEGGDAPFDVLSVIGTVMALFAIGVIMARGSNAHAGDTVVGGGNSGDSAGEEDELVKQRAAELKDEQLYSQGHERPEGDFCPLCTLPIPLPVDKHSHFKACCSKRSCIGCSMATQKRGMYDCPFCRTPMPKDDADTLAMVQARVAKKDPEAINHLAQKHFFGVPGLLQKDVRKAIKLWTEAAELGSIDALYHLGVAYYRGEGVQQDAAKAAEFYTKAAMQGHVVSRHNLGGCEGDKLNHDRAVRHFLISAKMGCKDSVETINRASMVGFATKEQYAEALKGYQDAVEEMKSPDRDEAAKLLGY